MASVSPDEIPFPETLALQGDLLPILLDCGPEDFYREYRSHERSNHSHTLVLQQLIARLSPEKVSYFLRTELSTPLLDALYAKLWLVARKDGNHIDPLHQQCVKGRQVVVNEDPKMHLIWTPDKIFLKPIPPCLLIHQFWQLFLLPSTATHLEKSEPSTQRSHHLHPNRALALGFLRSYLHLIKHQSDFAIAKESHLIPAHVDWTSWRLFISCFRNIPDSQVARRYHFGQMRHSRLNHLVRLTLPRERSTFWFYEPLHWSTAPYVRAITTSVGFVILTNSLVLSSMQVALAAAAPGSSASPTANFYRIFAIMIQSSVGITWILMAAIPPIFVFWQLWWGFRHRDGVGT